MSLKLPKGMAFILFRSLFISKDRENLGIGMEIRQRDGFFGSLVSPAEAEKEAKRGNRNPRKSYDCL